MTAGTPTTTTPSTPSATIGVSGLGSIGARHARIFGGIGGVRVIVFDRGADPATLVARVGAPVAVAASFQELVDSGLDGLVVATPDAHHAEQTIAACGRGLPVLLEKPIADTLDDGRRIVDAARAAGSPVLVGYVLHHVRCMRRAATLLADGAIGTPLSFQLMLGSYETLSLARNRFEGTRDGGLFVDYSHEWDYLRWLMAPVAGGFAVARTAGELVLRQRPNLIDAVLRLVDGTTGTAHLDYVQHPGTRRFAIIGDRGTLRVDAQLGTVRMVTADSSRSLAETLPEARDEAFRAQAEHFLDVVRGRAAPAVSIDDGFAALAVADALRRSDLEQRWVEVDDAVPASGRSSHRPPAD